MSNSDKRRDAAMRRRFSLHVQARRWREERKRGQPLPEKVLVIRQTKPDCFLYSFIEINIDGTRRRLERTVNAERGRSTAQWLDQLGVPMEAHKEPL